MTGLHIGISGWTYAPWRGVFFPEDLRQRDELAYASRQLGTIEINGTFYGLQRPASYASWHAQTPDGFIFSVKAPRFITHIKRLKNIERPLANFYASGVLRLNEKLGPFLWQLPPNLAFDPKVLEAFLRLLPRNTEAAAHLARRHDEHLRSRAWYRIDRVRPLRHALEVRHPSFECPEFVQLLRKHDIALVVADTAGKWPLMEDVTASDFVYVRLHGDAELYVSGYTPQALKRWAGKIEAWRQGRTPEKVRLHAPTGRGRSRREVFVYFDNDVKVRAPFDALSLAHLLGLGPKPARAPAVEGVLPPSRTRWPGGRVRRDIRDAA